MIGPDRCRSRIIWFEFKLDIGSTVPLHYYMYYIIRDWKSQLKYNSLSLNFVDHKDIEKMYMYRGSPVWHHYTVLNRHML